LIKRVWNVDPLKCPHCGGPMRIVSFINPWQRDVIEKILTHGGLSARAPPRADNTHAEPWRELRYENDLEFVQDAGPAELVWSAH